MGRFLKDREAFRLKLIYNWIDFFLKKKHFFLLDAKFKCQAFAFTDGSIWILQSVVLSKNFLKNLGKVF